MPGRRARAAGAASREAPKAPKVGVVGGGAAGLAAAWHAAREGAIVNVLERTEQAGKKVLISGGTRCNVLPASVDARRDFVTSAGSERLVRNVLKSWRLDGPGSCRAWLEEDLGLPLKLEDQPGGSAKWCVNYYFTILFFTRLTYGRRTAGSPRATRRRTSATPW